MVLLGTIQKKKKKTICANWLVSSKNLGTHPAFCFQEDFPGSFSNVFILFSALSQYVYDFIFSTLFSKTLNIRHKMKYKKKAEGAIEGRGSVIWSWIDQIDKSKQDSELQYNVNHPFPRCCIWVAKRPPTVRLYWGRCCISYFRLSFVVFWGSGLSGRGGGSVL